MGDRAPPMAFRPTRGFDERFPRGRDMPPPLMAFRPAPVGFVDRGLNGAFGPERRPFSPEHPGPRGPRGGGPREPPFPPHERRPFGPRSPSPPPGGRFREPPRQGPPGIRDMVEYIRDRIAQEVEVRRPDLLQKDLEAREMEGRRGDFPREMEGRRGDFPREMEGRRGDFPREMEGRRDLPREMEGRRGDFPREMEGRRGDFPREIEARRDLPREMEGGRGDFPREMEGRRDLPREMEGRRGDFPREMEGRRGDFPREMEGRRGDFPRELEDRRADFPKEVEGRRGDWPRDLEGRRADLPRDLEGRRVDWPRELEGRRVDLPREPEGRRIDLPRELEGRNWLKEPEGRGVDWPKEIEGRRAEWLKELEGRRVDWLKELEGRRADWPNDLDGRRGDFPKEAESRRADWPKELEGRRSDWEKELEGRRAEWQKELEGRRADWQKELEGRRADFRRQQQQAAPRRSRSRSPLRHPHPSPMGVTPNQRSSQPTKSSENRSRAPDKPQDTFGLKVQNFPVEVSDELLQQTLFQKFRRYGFVSSVEVHGHSEERYALVFFYRQQDQVDALIKGRRDDLLGRLVKITPWIGKETKGSGRPLTDWDEKTDEFHPRASRTLLIGNLDKTITPEKLGSICERFGDVLDVEMSRSQEGAATRSAFVEFCDMFSVCRAGKALDGELLGEHRVKAEFGKSVVTSCVWLDGLPIEVTQEYLMQRFSRYGQVAKAVYDRLRGRALVLYTRKEDAITAVQETKGAQISGWRLKVDFASDRARLAFCREMEESGQDTGDFLFV